MPRATRLPVSVPASLSASCLCSSSLPGTDTSLVAMNRISRRWAAGRPLEFRPLCSTYVRCVISGDGRKDRSIRLRSMKSGPVHPCALLAAVSARCAKRTETNSNELKRTGMNRSGPQRSVAVHGGSQRAPAVRSGAWRVMAGMIRPRRVSPPPPRISPLPCWGRRARCARGCGRRPWRHRGRRRRGRWRPARRGRPRPARCSRG